MHRYSLTLTQVLDADGDRPGITAFLESMNKTEADGSLAAAFDPTNTLAGGINAFKVAGADGAALLAGVTTIEVSQLAPDTVTREEATVGNKVVTVVSVGDGVNDTKWIYGHGDVVFVVHAANDTDAAAYLTALP